MLQGKMYGERGEGAQQDDLHYANATREHTDAGGGDENRRNGVEGDALIRYCHHAHLRKRP